MANGCAALAFVPLAIQPLTAPAPRLDSEAWIGALVAAMLDVSVRALRESEDGEISSELKRQGGDLVARLYELSRGELDFAAVVHRQAQIQLRRCRGVELSVAEVEATACWVIGMVAGVTASVQAEMH